MSDHGHGDKPYDIPHYDVLLRHKIVAVYWLVGLGITTWLCIQCGIYGVNHMLHAIHALGGGGH